MMISFRRSQSLAERSSGHARSLQKCLQRRGQAGKRLGHLDEIFHLQIPLQHLYRTSTESRISKDQFDGTLEVEFLD